MKAKKIILFICVIILLIQCSKRRLFYNYIPNGTNKVCIINAKDISNLNLQKIMSDSTIHVVINARRNVNFYNAGNSGDNINKTEMIQTITGIPSIFLHSVVGIDFRIIFVHSHLGVSFPSTITMNNVGKVDHNLEFNDKLEIFNSSPFSLSISGNSLINLTNSTPFVKTTP